MSDENKQYDPIVYVDVKTGHIKHPYTDGELVARGLELRDDIAAMKKAQGEELEPYEMALQNVENALLARMVERQSKSIGTEHGTAYQSHQLRVKMVDQDQFYKWLISAQQYQFLTKHVAKEAVKEYLETHDHNPPGLETTAYIQCNIRTA